MKDNCKFIYAAAFVLGCFVLGLCIVWATKTNKLYDRTVTVKGLCERQVKADNVIWPISFKLGGNDLSTLYRSTNEMNAKVSEFLTSAGINKDEITVNVPTIEDNRATSYNSNATFNYVMTSVVTVCSSDVDLVSSLEGRIGELIEKGVPVGTGNSWENRTEYSFSGLNDIKPEMIEEATANARAAATKFAKDSNSRIGKIKTASQGQFSIEDRDSNTPYLKNVRVVTSVVYYLND